MKKLMIASVMAAAICGIAQTTATATDGGTTVTATAVTVPPAAGASAAADANASASASSSAAAIRQADDQAMAYVGTWKTDKLTLQSKTNDSDKETDLDVPVALELNDNMTGTLTVGENTQNVEWEVRYWESLKIERAVISLHEPFELSGIVCDTENLMLEFANTENSARLFNHWTSSAQSGVKLGVDMTVEKVS